MEAKPRHTWIQDPSTAQGVMRLMLGVLCPGPQPCLLPPLMGTPTPVAVSQEGCPLEKTCTSGPGLLHAPAPTPLVHSCMNSHFSLETCTGLLLSLEL